MLSKWLQEKKCQRDIYTSRCRKYVPLQLLFRNGATAHVLTATTHTAPEEPKQKGITTIFSRLFWAGTWLPISFAQPVFQLA